MGWTTNLSVADWICEQVDSGENTFGTVHGVVATEPPSLFGAADWPASVPWQDRRAQKLIDELVADPVIEVLQLPPDANLTVKGDTINPDTAKPHTPEESAP